MRGGVHNGEGEKQTEMRRLKVGCFKYRKESRQLLLNVNRVLSKATILMLINYDNAKHIDEEGINSIGCK